MEKKYYKYDFYYDDVLINIFKKSTCYYIGLMLYIIWGGESVPCTPLYDVLGPSFALYSHVCATICLLVLSFWLLRQIRLSGTVYLRGWLEWRLR